MTSPLVDPSIPQIDLQITTSAVTAQTRKLKMAWSAEAAQDLRDLWGAPVWPRRPDNPLDLLKDALEDPNYDPNAPEPYEGLWRHEDGRLATPEEVERAHHPESALVGDMAAEMKAEIDREIAREIARTSGALSLPSALRPIKNLP